MRQKSGWVKPYGLRHRFTLSLTLSFLSCVMLFCMLYSASSWLISNHFERSSLEEAHIRRLGAELQQFIEENELSSQDLKKLETWERRNPVILLEVYVDGACLYSSLDAVYDHGTLPGDVGSLNQAVTVRLTDTEATAMLFSDYTYQYYLLGTVLSLIVSLAVFVLLFLRSNRKLIGYICRLNSEVQILEGGNLEYVVSVEGNDELTDLARSMNQMRLAFLNQIETEQRLHQASRDLVTQMSHDLRTPLTGIMLYLEILRTHRYTTEAQLQEYLEKIDAKAHHMKLISDHLFEYSLNTQPYPLLEPLSMEQALSGNIQEFREELGARGFSSDAELKWVSCFVQIPQEYLQRILENLLSNIEKYAEPAEPVRIDVFDAGEYCGVSMHNRCRQPVNSVESNRIGIESVQAMMAEMHGSCRVEQTESGFQITLLFRKQ